MMSPPNSQSGPQSGDAELADPFELAAAWLVRRDRGPLDAEEHAAFEAFLTDPQNARAWREAEGLWGGAAGASRDRAERRRRAARIGGTGVALALLLALAPGVWLHLNAEAITGPGEVRLVTLPDGSSARLAADSAIAVNYRGTGRHIRLLRGEAEFTAAPDPSRPFTVEAAGGVTRALGTVFLVERDGRRTVRVTGVEHVVRVSLGGQATLLRPGVSLVYDGDALSPVAAAPREAGDWRRGVLGFPNRPLGEAARELGRWRGAPVLVWGAGLSERPVNGVFRIDDLAAAPAALRASSLGLSVTELPGGWLLVRPG
jgi:transmembrane sensor